MKKSNLIVGIVYIMLGILCVLVTLFTETKIEGIIIGFAGALTGPGILMIYKYFYWSSPQNKDRYIEKLELEKIDMKDELKDKVRTKTAQYIYVINICIMSVSMLVFSVLDQLEIVENGKVFVLYLGIFLILQFVLGNIIFKKIMKRYI